MAIESVFEPGLPDPAAVYEMLTRVLMLDAREQFSQLVESPHATSRLAKCGSPVGFPRPDRQKGGVP